MIKLENWKEVTKLMACLEKAVEDEKEMRG